MNTAIITLTVNTAEGDMNFTMGACISVSEEDLNDKGESQLESAERRLKELGLNYRVQYPLFD